MVILAIVAGVLGGLDYSVLDISAATPSITYCSYVQKYGWLGWKNNGALSGTTGEAKRMEAMRIKLNNKDYPGRVMYRAYIQKDGWQSWKYEGAVSGTTNQSKRIEAIQIKLTEEMAEHYDIYYRVQVQSYGWLGWTKNGEAAGTAGMSRRIEGMQVKLVKKGASAPKTTGNSYLKYSDNMYRDTLSRLSGEYKQYGMSNKVWYNSLYDINGDGIKELLVGYECYNYLNASTEKFYYRLFTVVNGRVEELHPFPYENHTIKGFCVLNDGRIAYIYNSNISEDYKSYIFHKLGTRGMSVKTAYWCESNNELKFSHYISGKGLYQDDVGTWSILVWNEFSSGQKTIPEYRF